MARTIHTEPSRTLLEYRLLPDLTTPDTTIDRIDLSTPVASVKTVPQLSVPMVAAAMQSVSGDRLAAAMANLGSMGVIFCSQSVEAQAEMVARVKDAPVTGPNALCDASGRLVCAAALNTHDYVARLAALGEAGVDVVFLDASDGHSFYQGNALAHVRETRPDLAVVGGNVITARGFDYLVERGAQAVKVGMGSGSICITQEEKGTGRGLASALLDVVAARDLHRDRTGVHVPVIADGGLGTARDVTIALALGADYVMMGRFFAGVDESPNPVVHVAGRPVKAYWGEGSARAQEWKSHRYHQGSFVEGVEGYVPAVGPVAQLIDPVIAKIKAAMSSCGCATLADFRARAELEVVSALSIKEGEVHDIILPPDPAPDGGQRGQ